MAFLVLVEHGAGRIVVRFQTANQALAEARNQIEHGQPNVLIRDVATHTEFTHDEFAKKMMPDAYPEANG